VKSILAIAWREAVERRLVLAAAGVSSLVPLAVPLLRGLTGADAAAARAATAFVLSSAFGVGLVIALGLSIAPTIASRRIGFDFARPVSSLAIWMGRSGGALLLALAAAILVWIPAWLTGTEMPWRDLIVDAELLRPAPLVVLGGLVVLFAAAHAAGVMARSRSALLALDAALAAGAALALSAALTRLPPVAAVEARNRALWAFAIIAGVGLFAGGLASIARGRTDLRAAHRALSGVLWSFVAVGVAGTFAYASWVMAATPRDLRDGFWVTPAPAGSWVSLEGRARGASAHFLFDTDSGRFRRADTVDWWGPVISRDGRHAAWIGERSNDGPFGAIAMSLDEANAAPVRTRLVLPSRHSLFFLSPDGSRLATVADGVLAIHDVAGARTLAAGRLGENASIRGFFVGADRFRAYVQPDTGSAAGPTGIFELDAASKSLRKTGELDGSGGGLFLIANPSGERIVTIRYRDKETRLCDGRTGESIARLADAAADTGRWPGFLADGRIVLSERSAQAVRLLVFRPDGSPERIIPLPLSRFVTLGGEVEPNRIVVALGDGGTYASHLVAIDSGDVRPLAEDLYPAARLSGFAYEVNAAPQVGSEATRLFTRASRELVRLDPATGAQTLLLGKPQ
jgi:hypothetical protein